MKKSEIRSGRIRASGVGMIYVSRAPFSFRERSLAAGGWCGGRRRLLRTIVRLYRMYDRYDGLDIVEYSSSIHGKRVS
jgi:hypothetical protein